MYAREVTSARLDEDDRLSHAFAFVAVALPVVLATAHLGTIGDAAHDVESVRVLGLGFTGGWRALDAAWSAAFTLMPLGTRATRACLGSIASLGAVSFVLFELARVRTTIENTPRLGGFVALVSATLATLAPSMQTEADSIGGATLGVLIALLPRLLLRKGQSVTRVALLLGAALSYEPLVGLCALASVVVEANVLAKLRVARWRAAVAFAAGLSPLFVSIAMRRSTDLEAHAFAHPLGEGWVARSSPLVMLITELGVVALGLALGGLVLSLTRAEARREAIRSALVLAVTLACVGWGCAVGPLRWSPLALLAIAEVALLAAVGMTTALTFVRETKVPFAKASAWLAGIILLALVARQADDASLQLDKRTGEPARAFARLAWDSLPLGSLALVADQDVSRRIESCRAQGDIRADVAFVRLASAGALTEIAREPKLAPLLRDQALYGAPEEWSLSALAAARPVVLTFDPRWPRALSRHLVAVGLFDRFYSEPRGLSDRRLAIEVVEPDRLALTFALEKSSDPDLAHVTATLLRARLLGAAASGDRDVIGRALDELRPFAPGDPTAFEIVRRMTMTRGPIDLSDLNR
jgi:hypothetical protein